MRVHQAVFGARNGGHFLLAASGNQSFASRITQYTDRPGNPPMGVDWGPVIRGFFFDKHYVLLRTLLDLGAGRAGMVRSYAAFIPEESLVELHSLEAVFNLLPNTVIDVPTVLEPLEIGGDENLSDTQNIPHGLKAAMTRLSSRKPNLPLLWVSNNSYLPILNGLWKRIPTSLRSIFTFAYQFEPNNGLPAMPILVATLPMLASRWPTEQIIPIDSGQSESIPSGPYWDTNIENCSLFFKNAEAYGIKIQDFCDLHHLILFVSLVTGLSELNFSDTLKAVRIFEYFAKKNCVATDISKNDLFDRLCSLVTKATEKEISAIRNLDIVALKGLIDPLQRAIKNAIRGTKGYPGNQLENLQIAVETPDSWWSLPFLASLRTFCSSVGDSDGRVICELLESEKISKEIEPHLPFDSVTEEKLILGLPTKWSAAAAEHTIRIAETRSWMRLHAASLMRSRSGKEAIKIHAAIAGKEPAGFALMCEELGFHALLLAACDSDEINLIQYTGSILNDNSESIQIGSVGKNGKWAWILAHSLFAAKSDINETLKSAVISILEDPNTLPDNIARLVDACNNNHAALLLKVSDPSIVLDCLTAELKQDSIRKINSYVIERVRNGQPIQITNLGQMQKLLKSDEIVKALKESPVDKSAMVGVNAFRHLPFLTDDDCCGWLTELFTRTYRAKLSPEDCERISEILLNAEYPKAADMVQETVEKYQRGDVAPILQIICYKYHLSQHQQPKTSGKTPSLPKVIIATALPLERTEVIKHLENPAYDSELLADVALWPSKNPIFEIYVLTTGAGNLEAQASVTRALGRIRPIFAFFFGVAGGVKDSEIGDVIYSTKVHHYEGGKETEEGMKSRPNCEHTTDKLVQLAHRVAESAWQPPTLGKNDRKPVATPAVISSGEVVATSTSVNAVTFQLIKNCYNDTQVIDMESYGFLRALRTENDTDGMVVRGVSDKIKGKSETDLEGNQPLAAYNGAAFLFALLRACPEIFKQKKRKKLFGFFC